MNNLRCIVTVTIFVLTALPYATLAQVSHSDRDVYAPAFKVLDAVDFSADLRLRYQAIDRNLGLADGEAVTIRALGAAEFDFGNNLSLLGEAQFIGEVLDQFSDEADSQTGRPFDPEPEGLSLNRLKLVAQGIPKTRLSAGRQRIALDDWRFLGSFPFRQNDQTVDALRLETRAIDFGSDTAVLDIGVFDQVNRPLGPDNIAGVFNGTSWYANYGLTTPIGRVAAFHYDFALRTQLGDASTQTTGLRLMGRQHSSDFGIVWEASYARQKDTNENPFNFNVDYWLGGLSLEPGDWKISLRAEELGAQNGQALQTPLASLHRFSGLADQFIQTPPDGLRDVSMSIKRDLGDLGSVKRISLGAAVHNFEDAGGDVAYGHEIDVTLSARFGDALIALEYARYTANTFSTDTRSAVVSISYAFDN